MNQESLIVPQWPAPYGIRAAVTLRSGGFSSGPFSGLNLADHVGDQPGDVIANRQQLMTTLELPNLPLWMDQQHSSICLDAGQWHPGVVGDAMVCTTPDTVLAVMTADCVPILICDPLSKTIGVIHAGWRGLAGGVIGETVSRFPGSSLLAWLGPSIGPCHYEVGEEVRSGFVDGAAFQASRSSSRWMFDLWAEAARQLSDEGRVDIYGGGHCTYCDDALYSYRRDGRTGRFATLIWVDSDAVM